MSGRPSIQVATARVLHIVGWTRPWRSGFGHTLILWARSRRCILARGPRSCGCEPRTALSGSRSVRPCKPSSHGCQPNSSRDGPTAWRRYSARRGHAHVHSTGLLTVPLLVTPGRTAYTAAEVTASAAGRVVFTCSGGILLAMDSYEPAPLSPADGSGPQVLVAPDEVVELARAESRLAHSAPRVARRPWCARSTGSADDSVSLFAPVGSNVSVGVRHRCLERRHGHRVARRAAGTRRPCCRRCRPLRTTRRGTRGW